MRICKLLMLTSMSLAGAGAVAHSQTITVSVNPNPAAASFGSTVNVNLTIIVPYETTSLTSATGTCSPSGYDTQTLDITGDTMGAQGYNMTATFQLEAATEPETVNISCSVTASFSNSPQSHGSGSGSFTVQGCGGSATATPGAPDYSQPGMQVITWALSSTMNPGGPGGTGKATGTGVTGDLSNTVYANDCDNAPNDATGAMAPSIVENNPVNFSTYVSFTWTITTYGYYAVPCDACEANPSGYYPVQNTAPQVNSYGGELQGYCTF